MNRLMFTSCVVVMFSLILGIFPSLAAEIQVSVTISGDMDEILPILMQIKESLGQGKMEQEEAHVEVHSMTIGPNAENVAPPFVLSSSSSSVPTLSDAQINPNTTKAGESAQLTIQVNDPSHIVDTISAEIRLPEPISIDLFDKGDEGDAIAGDNVWTRSFNVPSSAPVGEYQVTIQAFDADGEPIHITSPDGTQAALTATTVLVVIP